MTRMTKAKSNDHPASNDGGEGEYSPPVTPTPNGVTPSMSKPNFSLLSVVVPESDPVGDAKHRLSSVSAILLIIHEWQQHEDEDLARRVTEEISLTRSQLRVLRQIKKTDTEPNILRLVHEAVNIPVTGYFKTKEEQSDGEA